MGAHLTKKASAESLNVIMLVTSPSPPSHVQSVLETFDFHANKVLGKKVEKETAWVRAFKESLKDGLWTMGAPKAKGKGKGPPPPKGGMGMPDETRLPLGRGRHPGVLAMSQDKNGYSALSKKDQEAQKATAPEPQPTEVKKYVSRPGRRS
eukprot:g4362.t1